ncbi:hypothetical protein LTR37_019653 [Vermiconidia calcicola]|uniref:Uncharacterized protein n=1 Tax=Vermiconidia calcicola TaxID=1690605 RepID=A0ACC3MFB7_9PEZI|nr:hypothetical protein LTR37_019653 [Vermiconidia calcicola]
MTAGAHRVAHLTYGMLKSYPMMLHHNDLPPFIHPSLVSSDPENHDMEPLTNCMSLMLMISGGVRVNRRLFWRNVRQDCERLCAEQLNLDKWQVLAAMQALLIYIVVRLDEGETDYNNFDSLLLKTVIMMAQRLGCRDIACIAQATVGNLGLRMAWKDWIYEELCVIYQVINMLVYFEPAAMCDQPSDLVLAPLPASKHLWEAGDEHTWKAEIEGGSGIQTAFGLAGNGELVDLNLGQPDCTDAVLLHQQWSGNSPSASSAKWEQWCSGMDAFGGLVMLAASLVG